MESDKTLKQLFEKSLTNVSMRLGLNKTGGEI